MVTGQMLQQRCWSASQCLLCPCCQQSLSQSQKPGLVPVSTILQPQSACHCQQPTCWLCRLLQQAILQDYITCIVVNLSPLQFDCVSVPSVPKHFCMISFVWASFEKPALKHLMLVLPFCCWQVVAGVVTQSCQHCLCLNEELCLVFSPNTSEQTSVCTLSKGVLCHKCYVCVPLYSFQLLDRYTGSILLVGE